METIDLPIAELLLLEWNPRKIREHDFSGVGAEHQGRPRATESSGPSSSTPTAAITWCRGKHGRVRLPASRLYYHPNRADRRRPQAGKALGTQRKQPSRPVGLRPVVELRRPAP